MIDGNENIYPTTDSNYINNSDDMPTVGVWGGMTLKQHLLKQFEVNAKKLNASSALVMVQELIGILQSG